MRPSLVRLRSVAPEVTDAEAHGDPAVGDRQLAERLVSEGGPIKPLSQRRKAQNVVARLFVLFAIVGAALLVSASIAGLLLSARSALASLLR